MRPLIAASIRNTRAILFSTIALCFAAVAMLASFPVSILPDVTFPRMVIIADAGERPARQVEVGVTRPLEEALAMVPNVTRIYSSTQRGGTQISVDFGWGTDMLIAQQLVNDRVNQARPLLPKDTLVTAERMNPTVFPILGLSLRSNTLSPSELWTLATYTVRPRLARVPGVARVVVQGGRVPEIAVDVDPRRIASYHLALDDVQRALAEANIVTAVGRMERRSGLYQALVSGQTHNVDEMNAVVIGHAAGVPILLSQVATVHHSTQDPTTMVTADGAPAVLLNIVRQPDANTVSVVDQTMAELETIKKTLPAGVQTGVWYDQAILVRDAVGSVRDAVLIGAGLSVLVLMVFLAEWRSTLVTAAIIPMTLLLTLLVMRLIGLTLNLMTLGALAVGIGLVIDDAIVVVENVVRHLSLGEVRLAAVEHAAAEIAAPMISSTLTTIVVFMPLSLVSGVAGAFFAALAITLTVALTVSLLLALCVSPSLCAAFLKAPEGGHGDEPSGGLLMRKLLSGYEWLLKTMLRRRWLTPLLAAGLAAATIWMGLRLPTGFMPEMDEGAFILDYKTPPGSSLTESNRLLKQIEQILTSTPEIKGFSRRTGTELGFAVTEPNSGDFAIELKPDRKRAIDEIINDVRERINKDVPGADVDFSQVLQDLIGDLSGAPAPIEIKLFGEDQTQLIASATSLADSLGKVPGTADIKSGVIASGPELLFNVDLAAAGRLGLSPAAIAAQAENAVLGVVPTNILEGDRQVPVRVRYPSAFRSSRESLLSVQIQTPAGSMLPLSSVGTAETIPGTTEINREDQRRMVSIQARLNGRDLGSVMRDVSHLMATHPLPAGVTYILAGQFKSQADSFRNLMTVLAVAILLVFCVMLFQFGSFRAPIVLMLVMPLALFGVVLGLLVTGTPLNVSSFMGAIMLVGIVVKNGILLLDRARIAEGDGHTPAEAVLIAGRSRLRPILMTTLTAILGLVPLAFGLGAGAQMQQPLAIAVIGGLSFSTLFTLIFAPSLYVGMRRD